MKRFLAIAWLLVACNVDPADVPEGVTSFQVRFTDGQDLGQTTPLPFQETGGVDLEIAVSPVGGSFDGWVTVTAEPGVVTSISGVESSAEKVRLTLEEGEETEMTVRVVLAYSSVRIWVEDEGATPATSAPAQCGDGVDNDGDDLVDEMQDPGCASPSDGSETGGSGALGVSPPVRFVNPRVASVQGSSEASPLEGMSVVMDRGTMVVTAINTDGFYITDIGSDAPAGGANSLFVFNYNTPWGLRECDIVTDVAGIVGEFYGYTELSFPSWTVVDPESRVPEPTSGADCRIPAPTVLTSTLVQDFWDMEALEAGLVRIEDGRIGDRFTDCDLDGDGIVSFNGSEGDCRENCDQDAECTEINTYFGYGQYAVVLDGCRGADCQKIWVVTRHVEPDFWADQHSDETISVLTGTLMHKYFLEPEWILEIRCPDDLVLSGDPMPDYQACVPAYARGSHYDDN